jgi:hypothetical protein
MGFAAGVAIVDAAEVAALSGETGLAGLDGGDGATLAATLAPATDAIIRAIKKWRGIDPAQVNNVSDFKEAAAYWVAWKRMSAQPDEDTQARAASCLARFESEIKTTVIDDGASNEAEPSRGVPITLNIDSQPYLNRPLDTRRPGRPLGSPWRPGFGGPSG